MIGKIKKEITDFVADIKDDENCTKLINYMNKNVYESIKLLMAVSNTFSVYGRVFMFFIISITGLVMLSSVGAMPFNVGYLVFIDVVLFALAIRFTMSLKRFLFTSIEEKRIELIESK